MFIREKVELYGCSYRKVGKYFGGKMVKFFFEWFFFYSEIKIKVVNLRMI